MTGREQFAPGDEVELKVHRSWLDDLGEGVVRRISDDGRLLYVEEPECLELQRYLRDEVRHFPGSLHPEDKEEGAAT